MPSQFKKFLSNVFSSAVNAIRCSCLLCGAENAQMICSDCQNQFFSATPNRCVSCALILNECDTHCGKCLAHPPAFHATTVACDYIAPLDQLILALKFEHQLTVAPTLGKLLGAAALATCTNDEALPDLLIPVPLGQARLAERGFNQAGEIAKPLAKMLNRPVYPRLLNRVRDTTAQTLLHPDQRQKNIKHAFSPNQAYSDKIRGLHIGVVDDVMTTGSTLHEIASCLMRHGAAKVSNFVFARTPPH